MVGLIKLAGKDPVALTKNAISAIKANRSSGSSVSADEIIYDDIRNVIESSFNVGMHISIETFKFIISEDVYQSPFGAYNRALPYTVFVGPKEHIDKLFEAFDDSGMGCLGEYPEGIIAGFVADEDLQSMASSGFIRFITDFIAVVACEELSHSNPWEIYNNFASILATISYSYDIIDPNSLYDHINSIMDMMTGLCGKSTATFTDEELKIIGSELVKLLKRPEYTKIISFLTKKIKEKLE